MDRPVHATVDNTCPVQFVVCLDVDAGMTLEHNTKTNRRWMKETWIRCSADGGARSLDGGM